MMRSLYSGVSGLKVHQTKMDVIGNNIANVNTVAFKSSSVTFSEVFYQTTQAASGSNAETGKGGTNAKQIGLGSNVGSISTSIENEGASQRTDNAFDLKIGGNSFFVVQNNGSQCFTRAGNFKIDDSGTLVTQTGAKVLGWQVDDDNNVVKDLVSPLNVKSAKFTYTSPAATTANTISGNLNEEDDSFAANEPVPISVRFYDSLGYSYTATVNVNQNVAADGTKTYTLTAGDVFKEGKKTNLTFTIDNTNMSFDVNTGHPIPTGQDADGNDICQFNMTFSAMTQANSGLTQEEWDELVLVPTDIDDINVDYSQLTALGDKTKITVDYGDTSGNNKGKAVGKMTGLSVQDDGTIVGSYSNGDVKVLGQIVVATFANPSGLEKIGDNYYEATLSSGLFDGIGSDITSTGGSISSGVLEMSNVDLASEFTEMITTQRGYQANSRIITVSDTMIEELVNLKR